VSGLSLVLALGIASALGSRGTTIGIVLGWQIVAAPLLLEIKTLGSLREALLGAATEGLAPAALFDDAPTLGMSLAATVVVLLAWAIAPLALGAWRTTTHDA
jgi:hypothetical protein